jgi:hypothetical protein
MNHLSRAAIVALTVALIAMATAASAGAQPRLGLAWSGSLTASEKWDTLKKSGATMYRIPVAAEKSAYGLDFAKYDEIFALAADRGIRILPILVVKEDGSGPVPTGQFDWFEFVRRAVRRYGHNGDFWVSRTKAGLPVQPVEAWEIWNEPNQNGVSAWEYGQFLGGTANVLQNASSTHAGKATQVLMGGILMWNGSGQGYFQTAWNQVKNEGSVTGVAIHPYAMCGDRLAVMKTSVNSVRNYLNANQGSSRSIWITEFGWPLGHWVFKNHLGQTECEFTFREADQAGHMQAALDWYQAQSAALNIPAVVWYNLRDDDQAHRWDTRIGLRDEAGHFRRAWYTFQNAENAVRDEVGDEPERRPKQRWLHHFVPGQHRRAVGPDPARWRRQLPLWDERRDQSSDRTPRGRGGGIPREHGNPLLLRTWQTRSQHRAGDGFRNESEHRLDPGPLLPEKGVRGCLTRE